MDGVNQPPAPSPSRDQGTSGCGCACADHPEGGCSCGCDDACPEGLRAQLATAEARATEAERERDENERAHVAEEQRLIAACQAAERRAEAAEARERALRQVLGRLANAAGDESDGDFTGSRLDELREAVLAAFVALGPDHALAASPSRKGDATRTPERVALVTALADFIAAGWTRQRLCLEGHLSAADADVQALTQEARALLLSTPATSGSEETTG